MTLHAENGRPVGTTGQRPTAPPGGRFQRRARGRALPSDRLIQHLVTAAQKATDRDV